MEKWLARITVNQLRLRDFDFEELSLHEILGRFA